MDIDGPTAGNQAEREKFVYSPRNRSELLNKINRLFYKNINKNKWKFSGHSGLNADFANCRNSELQGPSFLYFFPFLSQETTFPFFVFFLLLIYLI